MEQNNKPSASKKTEQARASNPWGNASTKQKVATGAAVAGGAILVGKKVSGKAILIALLSFVLALAVGQAFASF